MKDLHWDAINPLPGLPCTWDDPNLRWGSPSYYLEPGDPGFVPYDPLSPAPQPKPKRVNDMQVGLWSATVSVTVGGLTSAESFQDSPVREPLNLKAVMDVSRMVSTE